jgi:hypothetical protein
MLRTPGAPAENPPLEGKEPTAMSLAADPRERGPELRAALAERESYAYSAARGMLSKTLKANRDRPAKAVRVALATLTGWAASCDFIAAAGRLPDPAEGGEYAVRLTPKGLAAAATVRAAGGVR